MATDNTNASIAAHIKYQLIRKVSALSSVAACYAHEKMPVDKYPAVFIKQTAMDGEFWTNASNRRTYSYRLLILFSIGSTPSDVTNFDIEEFAENQVAAVADDIMNNLDNDFQLGNDYAVLFLNALDYVPDLYRADGGGYFAGAEMTVQVVTEYLLT